MAAMSDIEELSSSLRSLIESVDWEVEEERSRFFRELSTLIWDRENGGWNDLDRIELQDFFEDVVIPDSELSTIEHLLFDALKCGEAGKNFIKFVASTGYRDETEYDENDVVDEIRETPLLEEYRPDGTSRVDIIDELFKIYDDYSVNYVEPEPGEGYSHLHVAVQYNRIEIARQILEQREDPNISTYYDEAPLHIAVCEGLREMAELLLRHGACPNWKNLEKSTPLHLICEKQDADWARMLFRICGETGMEVDIDAQDFRKYTPLMVALEEGERELVQLLLQQGADPNLPDIKKRTPLHEICRYKDLDWASWFFEICAKKSLRVAIDAEDNEGCTPLIVALKLRKSQLAVLLLCMGASPDLSDSDGATASALHTVCHYRDDDEAVEAAQMLFAARARLGLPPPLIDAPDKRGNRPLHLAAMRGNRTKLVDYLLLGRGASVILANSAGRTFLHLIGRGQGNVDAARRLFELHGGEGRALLPEVVDARDAANDTPLHLAARNRNSEAIELLLRYGADPNAVNARGLTPLHEILLERTGDFDCDEDDDDDYYDYAMKDDDDMIDDDTKCLAEKFIEIVEMMRKTVQVDVQDENGDAPLHLALRQGKKKAAELLLRRGANPNLANATGETGMFLVCNLPTPNEEAALELATLVFEFSQERFKPLQLNVRDRRGLTALHCPLGRGEKRLVRLLLDGGIDPNLATESGNALHHAVFQNCDVDMVRLIFERCQARNLPLDINARDSNGSTPLLVALHGNRDELFQFLLRSGADPNKANHRGETCVHHACKFDHRPQLCERARALFAICRKINQPVLIDAEDNEGRTPLQWAVARHSPTMVDLLVDQGADLTSFLFPTRSYLNASSREARCAEKKFILAAGTLATLERLQARGYEPDRADVLEIKKYFTDWHLLEDTPDREYKWYDDEEFATAAKQMKIDSSASLYDLIKTPVNDKRLPLKSMEFYEFACKLDWLKLPDRLWDVCARHLCQRLPRTFFEQWSG